MMARGAQRATREAHTVKLLEHAVNGAGAAAAAHADVELVVVLSDVGHGGRISGRQIAEFGGVRAGKLKKERPVVRVCRWATDRTGGFFVVR